MTVKLNFTSSASERPLRRAMLRRPSTSCEVARVAAELALTMTVGGDMPSPAGATLGIKALAAPCRLQLLRLSAGYAADRLGPAQSAPSPLDSFYQKWMLEQP